MQSRREFVRQSGSAAIGLASVGRGLAAMNDSRGPGDVHLSCSQYPWSVFFERDRKNFELDSVLAQAAASGMDGYEPLVEDVSQIGQLVPLLEKNGLEMRSLYVNSVLHDSTQRDGSIGQVLRIAEKAREYGTSIVVTNPKPISWGGPENKTDDELRTQAMALNRLGEELTRIGVQLSYHNHDMELRNAARELHHMLLATDPANVTFCLDVHWVFRGAGDSSVALFDVMKLYGHRITEVHLRQSTNGVWCEYFREGDIDYSRVFKELAKLDLSPHLVMEQAVENGSPETMNAAEAHRRSSDYLRKLLKQL